MRIEDVGSMRYAQAWALQEKRHGEVLAGAQECLILVEHPPVITFGRRAEIEGRKHLVASEEYLKQLGVELVQSDRGGDITFHGPGQIVAYPIVRLNDHALSVGGYVRKLEQIIIDTLHALGVEARRIDKCVGVWVGDEKVCALGVRIRRGVSLHGIALNVETDLNYFDLIVPCGLAGKRATSLRKILGDQCPSMEKVRQALTSHFVAGFPAATEAVRPSTASTP